MTLGGLALAVGILVDDFTVTIENTHRLLTEEGQPLPQATLHGAAGIAVPTLVSTLAISCVFTSVVFLDGPAKYLFTPLGLAVVFAMLASYGAVADAHADHHRPAAQERTSRPDRWRPPRVCSRVSTRPSSAASSGCVMPIRGLLTDAAAAPPHRSDRRRASNARARGRHVSACRPRFLSGDRRWPDPASRPRARPEPASRRPSESSRRSKTRSARSFRRTSASSSSTISGCRRGPTISPLPTARPSASMTA